MIRAWLKAGVVEKGHFTPTQAGAPQGGAISPLILNIVLHGMETAAGVGYRRRGQGLRAVSGGPVLVRYADDALALCHSSQQAEQVKERLAQWLAPRGLVFNEDKTRIVHVNQGCDFLGFNIRRYHNKLPLIKPSKDAVRRIRLRLRTEMRARRGGNAAGVLRALTPVIRGWAAFYRSQVSSEIFSALDDYMWKLLYKWAKRTHPNKGRRWCVDRYFGRFNPASNNRWVFGDKQTGAYLPKFAWTKIVRHVMVAGTASPDDPTLTRYWAGRRRRKPKQPLNAPLLAQLKAQRGRCWLCGTRLLNTETDPQSPQEWEFWLRAIQATIRRKTVAIGEDGNDQRLIHTTCQDRTSPPAVPALLAVTPSGPA
jgi:RNA-directed DNA polymerase